MEYLNTKIGNLNFSYITNSVSSAAATVIFIHGFPFNKSIWNRQIESLPPGINAIAYDIRGFGSSASGYKFYSIDLFAKDLLALIHHLKLENCVLCGISMGGYIALRTFELSAEPVRGLVLCDTNAVADSNEGKIKRFNVIEQILEGKKAEFTAAFIKNVFYEETLNSKPEVVRFLQDVIMNTADETICAAQLAMASRTDTSDVLERVNVPALILRGEHDKLMSDEQTRQLGGIPKSEVISIVNAGHLPNLENPEDFNNALNHFLNKHFLS